MALENLVQIILSHVSFHQFLIMITGICTYLLGISSNCVPLKQQK